MRRVTVPGVSAHQPFPARTASREQAEPAWPPAIDSSGSQ
jgi:hypothetical protein